MRIGVLQCDSLDPPAVDVAGDYDRLYRSLIGGSVGVDAGASERTDTGIEFAVFRADLGRLPASPHECDAWLIGGSRRSVYDDVDWVDDLRRFAAVLVERDVTVVGICFGHQLLGQALGAPVRAAACGWTVGAAVYDLVEVPPGETAESGAGGACGGTSGTAARRIRLAASHRDQVLELPDGATLLASSARTPVAAFRVGDSILSIQPHPEFTSPVIRALVAGRAGRLPDDVVADALASVDLCDAAGGFDHRRVAAWIRAVCLR